MSRLPHPDDTMNEATYRARSAELRGMAARMSSDLRETMLDAAAHWETLAKQAEALARSKKLIKDWERGRDNAYAAQSDAGFGTRF